MSPDALHCPRCYASADRRDDACPRCQGPLRLQRRYALLRRLGAGATGTTWEAQDATTQARVAIKELSFRRLPDLKTLELFEREVQTLRHLRHPNIPRYLDHFQVEEPRHVALYLVQELIEGSPLDLRGWDEPRLCDLLRQLAGVLAYLADRRPPVVHRDLKPDNIMATPQGRFVLIDFGATRHALQSASHGSTLSGTLGYMAPEQLLGRADPRADLYALGATAVALLTAREAHLVVDPHQPDAWRQQLHASLKLKNLLSRLLQPRPEDRLACAADLLRALDDLSPAAPGAAPSEATRKIKNKKQNKNNTKSNLTPATPPPAPPASPRPKAAAPPREVLARLKPVVELARQWNRDLSELPLQLWIGSLATLMGIALLGGLAQGVTWVVTGEGFSIPQAVLVWGGGGLAGLGVSSVLALLIFGGALERAALHTDPQHLRHLRRLRWGLPRSVLIGLYDPTGWGVLKRVFTAWGACMLAAGGVFLGGLLISALAPDSEPLVPPFQGLDVATLNLPLRVLIPSYLLGPTLLGWLARRRGALWLERWELGARHMLRRDEDGQRLLQRLLRPPGPRDDLQRLADDLGAWAAQRDLSPEERAHLGALALELIAGNTSLASSVQGRLDALKAPRGRGAARALMGAAWAVRGAGHTDEHLRLSARLAALAHDARAR